MNAVPFVWWFLGSLIILLAAPAGLTAQATPVTLGVTTRTGTTGLPFVIAEEKGFFKSEGVNAIVVVMQNQVVVNGVVTRNVDYGGTFSNFIGALPGPLPKQIHACLPEAVCDYSQGALVLSRQSER